MDESYLQNMILEAKKNLDEARPYLNRIPILKNINNIKPQCEVNQKESNDISDVLATLLSYLMKDVEDYLCTYFKRCRCFYNDNDKEGFFGFYDYAKKWLRSKYANKSTCDNLLKKFKLDEPYELAKELFVEYINFRLTATLGAQYVNPFYKAYGEYKPNIYDLFTDEALIELGGNEFIRDCYTAIGENNLPEQYKLNNKSCIQNIDSRTGAALESDKDVKPNLYERVDNHLSWTIFKDGKVKNLNEYEISILQKAMQNEGFWKHLGKTELKILPFTGGAALILGLIAAFAFGATGGALLAVILTPIGAGALGIAPSVTPSMRKSAIVDKMIDIDNPNKEFSDQLKQGEEEYQHYKENNDDFIKFLQSKSEPAEEKNIKEKDNNIKEKDKDIKEKGKDIKEKKEENNNIDLEPENNKIIPKSNAKPLGMANKVKGTADQHQHGGNNQGKNDKKPEEEKT